MKQEQNTKTKSKTDSYISSAAHSEKKESDALRVFFVFFHIWTETVGIVWCQTNRQTGSLDEHPAELCQPAPRLHFFLPKIWNLLVSLQSLQNLLISTLKISQLLKPFQCLLGLLRCLFLPCWLKCSSVEMLLSTSERQRRATGPPGRVQGRPSDKSRL